MSAHNGGCSAAAERGVERSDVQARQGAIAEQDFPVRLQHQALRNPRESIGILEDGQSGGGESGIQGSVDVEARYDVGVSLLGGCGHNLPVGLYGDREESLAGR